MKWSAWSVPIGLITLALVYAICSLVAVKWLTRRNRVRKNWVKFIRSTVSILRSAPVDEQLRQLERLYERYTAAQTEVQQGYRSLSGELWTIVGSYDWRLSESFKKHYGVDLTADDRKRLVQLVEQLEERQPFAQLPSPWNTRLHDIRTSLESNNVPLGLKVLEEVAQDLSQREEIARKQEELRFRNNNLLQWLGVVLTVVTFIVGAILTFLTAGALH
jgi:hypothetical protein